MKEYNGHRSWNAWNVCLWISNDEQFYRLALDGIKLALGDSRLPASRAASRAARTFRANVGARQTPDGAVYNQLSVKLAMLDLME